MPRYKLLSFSVLILAASCTTKKKELGPVILNVSTTARAGDIVYVQGAGFGSQPLIEFSYNDSHWQRLTPISLGSQLLTFRLPVDGQPALELIAIHLSRDGKLWSEPAFINSPHIVHFGTADVAPGGIIRAFGRNLFYSRQPAARFVDTDDNTSFPATAEGEEGRSYQVKIRAPANLVPGHSYKVLVSNGYHGRNKTNFETEADKTLQCRPSGPDSWGLEVPWAADLTFFNNVYNVRSDSRLKVHARGDGSFNDLLAIQEAVDVASHAGGGVVFLPAGTYRIDFPSGCGIGLQKRVVLAGAGAAQTTVNYGYGTAPKNGGYAVCFAPELSGLVDVSFKNINESGHWPQSALGINSKKLFLQRVNWEIGTSQWITLTHSDNLAIENSRITQGVDSEFNGNGPLEVRDSTHFLLKHNTITYAVWGIDLSNMRDGIFETNTIVRDATDRSAEQHVTHVISASFTSDIAILDNQFLVKGTLGTGRNDGETILSEGGGPYRPHEVHGVVGSVDTEIVTDDNTLFPAETINPELQLHPSIVIVNGEGLGQWRTIKEVVDDGHSVVIDAPWKVLPAPGDHYAVVNWSAENWIIAGNTMSGNEKGIEFFNASLRNLLITHNTMTDNSGILISPDQRGSDEFNVAYGIEISDNVITDNRAVRPAHISIVPREDSQVTAFGTAVLGAEIKRNKLSASRPNTSIKHTDDEKAVVEGFNCYWQWQTAAGKLQDSDSPVILGAIFQGNSAVNSDVVFYLNTGSYQTHIDGTIVRATKLMLRDDVVPGASHASVGTVIVGTASDNEQAALDR